MYEELIMRLRKRAVNLKEKFSRNAELLSELMQAADAIEELSKPRWIPVTETPQLKVGDDGYNGYLVYANGHYEVADYTTDKFDNVPYFHVDGEYEPDVTHYMPLPQPPKYDRIVSKTPEELAVFASDLGCHPSASLKTCRGVGHCSECWLDWLKQEADHA